jgi:hypothetical protein
MRVRSCLRRHWFTALSTVTIATLGTTAAAEAAGGETERLGKVEFKVECNAAAQQKFNHGMALYHSFVWPAATVAFEEVAAADPTCGMAHWGRAMVLLDNPFVWPANLPPRKLKEVARLLESARSSGLKSQREKDYIEALSALVNEHEKVDHRTRMQAYDDAMAKLAARHADDMEASILSALATSANFNPADKAYANQLKAAGILEPLSKEHPDHPGITHYLIHSYDYPPIAKQGLEAAKRYAQIAPDAPHALHMPSHIFTRVGHWQDSVAANRTSAKVAGDKTYSAHHSFDYMVYAHLQLAQDRAARQVMEQSQSMKVFDHFAAAYAYAAMPARLALERDDWKAAADLALVPAADAYPWKKYPHAEAVNAFTRGIGAARAGDAAAAKEQHARLLALRDSAKTAKLTYWVEQISIQAELVRGLGLCAEGKAQECQDVLRQAAAREDASEKHVVTPGPILPARELYADMLLAAKKPGDALTEYEAVLGKEPNRSRALAGAMLAARETGDRAKAGKLAADLLSQGGNADSEPVMMQEAKLLAGGK